MRETIEGLIETHGVEQVLRWTQAACERRAACAARAGAEDARKRWHGSAGFVKAAADIIQICGGVVPHNRVLFVEGQQVDQTPEG